MGGAGQQLGPTANVYSIAAVSEYSQSVEPYSETGPATVYYSATETGTQNGVPILSYSPLPQPLVINHPDLAGIDNVSIGTVGNFSGSFWGTSAAAPTVGGVVALMLQAKYTKTEIIQSLEATAKPVPAAGQTSTGQSPDTWDPNDGYGLVQVWAALQNAGLLVPQPSITNPSGFGTTISAGGNVNFASSCIAPAGQTVTGYSWTFTGSSGAPPATTQQDPAVTFSSAGSYTANLTCTDSQGITNPNPQQVTITVNAVNSGGGSSKGGGGGAFSLLELAVLLGLWIIGMTVPHHHGD